MSLQVLRALGQGGLQHALPGRLCPVLGVPWVCGGARNSDRAPAGTYSICLVVNVLVCKPD